MTHYKREAPVGYGVAALLVAAWGVSMLAFGLKWHEGWERAHEIESAAVSRVSESERPPCPHDNSGADRGADEQRD